MAQREVLPLAPLCVQLIVLGLDQLLKELKTSGPRASVLALVLIHRRAPLQAEVRCSWQRVLRGRKVTGSCKESAG